MVRGSGSPEDVRACLGSRGEELGVESREFQRLTVTAETCEGVLY